MIETKPPPEIEKQFAWLNSAIQRVGNDAQMRVSAHLRTVTNGRHFLLPNYHADPLISHDDKSALYKNVFTALVSVKGRPDYLFPNGETVERHPKFYTLALANTKGCGATNGYVARNRLDAATLDRFAVIEIKYDAGLELALACGQGSPSQPWRHGQPAQPDRQKRYVEWVQKVRQQVGNSVLISPRASINGCRALRHGIPMAEVVEALVFKLVADDSRKRIADTCGQPPV